MTCKRPTDKTLTRTNFPQNRKEKSLKMLQILNKREEYTYLHNIMPRGKKK